MPCNWLFAFELTELFISHISQLQGQQKDIINFIDNCAAINAHPKPMPAFANSRKRFQNGACPHGLLFPKNASENKLGALEKTKSAFGGSFAGSSHGYSESRFLP
jgi:hypothetical protein